MKDNLIKKIEQARIIKNEELVDNLKSNYQEKYDQMIVSSAPIENSVYYLRYHARIVNYKPTKVKFILDDTVKHEFESNYEGSTEAVAEVSESFLEKITEQDTNISEDSISSPSAPGIAEKVDSMFYLKNGFQNWLKKNGSPADFGEEISKNSIFSKLSIGSASGSDEYQKLKTNYFKHIPINFDGNSPSEKQSIFYIPNLTKSCECDTCKGQGEMKCPTCSGSGDIDCPGEVVANDSGGPAGNKRLSCKHGNINSTDSNVVFYQGNKYKHRKCNGTGKVTCSRTNNSAYGIGKAFDAATGKDFCEGKGTITCEKCKGHGRLGEMTYVKLETANIDSEYFTYQSESIPNIEKSPEILYNFLDTSGLVLTQTYQNDNGNISTNYDSFTSDICKKIQDASGLTKDDYPKLFVESVYYDLVPARTLEYNHFLTATMHKLSFIGLPSLKDILFHTNPTAVKHFSFKNIFLIYKSKWSEAFIAKSYKDKRDKYNEIRMLIYVAKADGTIAEEEKLVLANAISGMTEYSASEKSALFGLMTAKELKPLENVDFVISTKERAEIVFTRLKEMAMEDKRLETQEVKIVGEFTKKIEENLGKYPSKFKQVIKTWQVSVTILLLLISLAFSIVYFMFIKPKKDAELLHSENIKSEKNLLDFIQWTSIDTLNNLDYTQFKMNQSLNESTDNIKERSESVMHNDLDNSPESILNNMIHPSLLNMDGTEVTYAKYWEDKVQILKKRLDSLNLKLEYRKQLSTLSKSSENSKVDNLAVEYLKLSEISLGNRVIGNKVSDLDGEYLIDGINYIIKDGEIIDVIPVNTEENNVINTEENIDE
jgi:hypothetical protein